MPQNTSSRMWIIDMFRGLALIAMIIFHFTFDLSYFGFISAGTVYQPNWVIFQLLIAGSFIFASGFCLEQAHGNGIHWQGLRRRYIILGGAAAIISLVTFIIFGAYWIKFGILHCIFACNLLGLLVVWQRTAVLAIVTTCLILTWIILPTPLEINPIWDVLVRTTTPHLSVDYRPIFPWVVVFFIGMFEKRRNFLT